MGRPFGSAVAFIQAFSASAALLIAGEADLERSIAFLNEQGIELNRDAAGPDLGSALISPDTLERTRFLLDQLTSEEYQTRENASRELAKLEAPIDCLLRVGHAGASATGDLELNWRLQQIIAIRRTLALEERLYHALVVISGQRIPGLGEALLTTAAALDEGNSRLLLQADEAIAATMTVADKENLLKWLRDDDAALGAKLRAGLALGSLLARSGGMAELESLIQTAPSELRLAAIRGAMQEGRTAGVLALGEMLSDPSATVRCNAAELLRRITGDDFGYAGYDPEEPRRKAAARWQQSLTASQWPDKIGADRQSFSEQGRVFAGIVVAQKRAGRGDDDDDDEGKRKGKASTSVLEFSQSGSIRWRMDSAALRGGFPVAAAPLSRGARVIAFGKNGSPLQKNMAVRFFDANGLILGTISGLMGINTLEATPDGSRIRIVVAEKAIELDLFGNVTKRTSLPESSPGFFATLPTGRILTASRERGLIREYGAGGEVRWEAAGFGSPIYARRLADGALVVASSARDRPAVVSYTADGEIHWDFTPAADLGTVNCATALSNGNALLGTTTGLYEITVGGHLSRTWINGNVTFLNAN